MGKTNTEKPTGKAQSKKMMGTGPAQKKTEARAPLPKEKKKNPNLNEATKKELETRVSETKPVTKEGEENAQKGEDTKKVEKKIVQKTWVSVKRNGIHASPKVAAAISRFIARKSLEVAIRDLEEVVKMRKAVPMKGEIPHRKGRIMSGRFPIKAARQFLVLLKSLGKNAQNHDVGEPIITRVFTGKGATVYGKMGRVKRKQANVEIIATEKKLVKEKKNGRKKHSKI